jgi:hypothetical protein
MRALTMTGMKIPNVSKLIADCWMQAEVALQQAIESKFPDCDEEIITKLFQGELQSTLELASQKGTVEQAFFKDLKRAFPSITPSILSEVSSGLIATVNFHSKNVEKKTGGDFGLVLIRPDFHGAEYNESKLIINHDYRRGLLCQAKVFRRSKKWGDLSRTQKQVLPERLGYFALVLYQYCNPIERRKLSPFQWQLTSGNTVENISLWLKTNQFPDLQTSNQIVGSLAQDRIGTDDKKIISEFIAPPSRPSLEIRVRWRDGEGPGESVQTHVNTSVRQHAISRR